MRTGRTGKKRRKVKLSGKQETMKKSVKEELPENIFFILIHCLVTHKMEARIRNNRKLTET